MTSAMTDLAQHLSQFSKYDKNGSIPPYIDQSYAQVHSDPEFDEHCDKGAVDGVSLEKSGPEQCPVTWCVIAARNFEGNEVVGQYFGQIKRLERVLEDFTSQPLAFPSVHHFTV